MLVHVGNEKGRRRKGENRRKEGEIGGIKSANLILLHLNVLGSEG